MSADNNRTRTVTWDDPMVYLPLGQQTNGLELMRMMIAGKIPPPPIARLMNFTLVEVDEGRAVFAVEPAEFHYNPIGVVHGGLISTLLDSALGCAVHTTLPAGTTYTSLELHVNFVRPLTRTTGEVRCEARVLHTGRRMATAEAKVTDAAGKLYGHGTTTCMVFPPEKG